MQNLTRCSSPVTVQDVRTGTTFSEVQDGEPHYHPEKLVAAQNDWLTLQAKFPEHQRVSGTELDERRSTWVLLHNDLRRIRRVRLFVDYLCATLLERRADFISGQIETCALNLFAKDSFGPHSCRLAY